MPDFAYQANDSSGRRTTGVVTAADASGAAGELRSRGLAVLDVQPKGGFRLPSLSPGVSKYLRRSPGGGNVELSLQQLATMLRSGLTLLEAIRTVAAQSRRAAMRDVWLDVAARIRNGSSFTDALAAHGCFGRLVVQLAEVGEQTGNLDMVMTRAAVILRQRRQLKAQVVTAMLYPAVVLLAAIGVTIFMLVYAIPKITVYLQALGRPLPGPTQFLVDLSGVITGYWLPVTLAVLFFGVACTLVYLWPPARLVIDRVMLRVPLLGYILRTSATAGFSRAMSILISSGVTVVEGLRTAEKLHRNRYLARTVAGARDSVIRGGNLSEFIERPGAFMPMLTSMIAVGERAGTLDAVLLETAEFHEDRLAVLIKTLSTLAEIAVVLVVGGIVGYVYVAFLMALYGGAL